MYKIWCGSPTPLICLTIALILQLTLVSLAALDIANRLASGKTLG